MRHNRNEDMHTFATRHIILIDEQRRAIAYAAVRNAPLGIEVVLREPVKVRKPDQNSLMWAGPLRDIAAQAWVDGRQYSAEVWHEHLKRLYLPETHDPDLAQLVRSPYAWRKWDYTPDGDLILIGSTTGLTVRGFSQYLEQVYAYGAGLGVLFQTKLEEP